MTQRLTIGNFNVRNLVPKSTGEGHHYFYSPGRHNCYWGEGNERENRYQQKIQWLACQLDRMDADIVCFQEIFAPEPLEDVIAQSRFAGQVKLYYAGQPDFKDRQFKGHPARIYYTPLVALMVADDFEVSEFSILDKFPQALDFSAPVKEHSGRVWQLSLSQGGAMLDRFTRPVLRARIRLPKRFSQAQTQTKKTPEMTLFSAHFKSKRPIEGRTRDPHPRQAAQAYLREYAIGRSRSLLLRGLEAAALRSYVLDALLEDEGIPVVVVGDLNDGPRSETTEIAGGLTQPLLNRDVANDFKKREAMMDAVADLCLYSAYHQQTQRTHRDVYYTHIFDGFHDVLDHVLVSSHFIPLWAREGRGRDNLGKIGTLRVFNDHLVNADVDDLSSDKVGRYLHTRSDHGQVTVRLDWFDREQPGSR